MKSINVILTTTGRSTLGRMLESLVNQLQQHDYLTVISDDGHNYVRRALSLPDFKCTVTHIQNDTKLGYWGHASRTKWQNKLPGDYLMNADDDDVYVPGAFDVIRSKIGERKLYLFKHKDEKGLTAWSVHGLVKEGCVGTSCGVIPNTGDLPVWENRYGGDGKFYEDVAKMMPVQFEPQIIYLVRNATL